MDTRTLTIAAVLAISVTTGAAAAVALNAPQRGASAAAGDTATVEPTRDSGPQDATASLSLDVVGEPTAHGSDVVQHAHPEPFETSDDRTRRAHRRAVLDYLEVAWTFLPADELGSLHHRATDTLHPDANGRDAGVLVASVPPVGHTRRVDVVAIDLALDTGSKTMWTVATQLVEVPDGGGPSLPVPGHSTVTRQVTVTDWRETPLVLEQTVDPDPVP